MRIISDFKDFYDTALAMGADSRVAFIRHSQSFDELPEEWEPMRPGASGHAGIRVGEWEISIRPLVIAFCGVIYHGVGVESQKAMGPPDCHESFFYRYEDYATWCAEQGAPLTPWPRRHTWKHHHWRTEPYHEKKRLSLRHIEPARAWFEDMNPTQYRDLFVERKVPVATCVGKPGQYASHNAMVLLEINGSLANYQFYRVFGAYEAYQELSMFMAGVLSGEDGPMAGIDDDSLRREKGFDCHSFRKAPTKRRPKECKG